MSYLHSIDTTSSYSGVLRSNGINKMKKKKSIFTPLCLPEATRKAEGSVK